MAKSRNILPPRRFWLQWEEEFLRNNYADALTVHLAEVLGMSLKRVLAKANAMGLKKSKAVIAETARERSTRPDHGGRKTRIQPGTAPWNKGQKGVTGTQEACRPTQFKAGHKPYTWLPIGTYRVVDGQLQQKVNDLPGANHIRWHPVSRLVWEKAHGPVPSGHKVVFRPGQQSTDPERITLDTVELVTFAELMRRNSIHTNYPPELAEIARLRGVLNRTINRKVKETA